MQNSSLLDRCFRSYRNSRAPAMYQLQATTRAALGRLTPGQGCVPQLSVQPSTGFANGLTPCWKLGRLREQREAAKAKGAAGQLLFLLLTMADFLVTSLFWEQSIIGWNYNAVLMLPLLALSSDNEVFRRSRRGMTAVNTHWVTPHSFK